MRRTALPAKSQSTKDREGIVKEDFDTNASPAEIQELKKIQNSIYDRPVIQDGTCQG